MQAQIITDEKYANKIAQLNQPKQNPKKQLKVTNKENSKKVASQKVARGQKVTRGKKVTKGKIVTRGKSVTRRKKRRLEDDAIYSDSSSVSSVLVSDANTSSDLSLKDFLSDHLEEEIDMEDEEATETTTFSSLLQVELPADREEIDDLETIEKESEGRDGSHDEAIDGKTDQVTLIDSITEDSALNKYVAVYYSDPNPTYYWGKVLKVFSNDEDTAVDKVEVDFLRRNKISSCPSEVDWTHKAVKEILIVEKRFILYGPVVPEIRGRTFRFPDVQAMAALQKLEESGR